MAMEKFHFEHDGKKYSLPLLNAMKMGLKTQFMDAVKQSRDGDDLDSYAVFPVLVKFAGPEAGAAFEDMEEEEFGKVFEAWGEATKAAAGK